MTEADQTETFSKTFFGGVKSSLGYIVFFNSRSVIEYRDNCGNRIFVSAEGLLGPADFALYSEDMRIGSPRGQELLDAELRCEVKRRVLRAAKAIGIEIDAF